MLRFLSLASIVTPLLAAQNAVLFIKHVHGAADTVEGELLSRSDPSSDNFLSWLSRDQVICRVLLLICISVLSLLLFFVCFFVCFSLFLMRCSFVLYLARLCSIQHPIATTTTITSPPPFTVYVYCFSVFY